MGYSLELSLDCKPENNILQTDRTLNPEVILARLDEEMLKIGRFKVKVPLCMQLLADAQDAYRKELQANGENHSYNEVKPALEEFIPLQKSSSDIQEKQETNLDKSNWMTSAQLWIQGSNVDGSKSEIRSNAEMGSDSTEEKVFSKIALVSDKRKTIGSNGVAVVAGPENGFSGNFANVNEPNDINFNYNAGVNDGKMTRSTTIAQAHRKSRRCWSPELHRRFVNALQMLGGSQVATPKNIRQLMKVDGLTNDEVKSHLQKYRLHTRRPSQQASQALAPQLVVLRGIWLPPEYAENCSLTARHFYSPLEIPNEAVTTTPQPTVYQDYPYKPKSAQVHSSPDSIESENQKIEHSMRKGTNTRIRDEAAQ